MPSGRLPIVNPVRDTDTETSGLETREYVLQNWRADVVALAAPANGTSEDGDRLERVSYDARSLSEGGIPFGTHPTDLTRGAVGGVTGYGMPDGTLNNDVYSYFLILYGASNWRADWDRDGDIDAADHTAYLADYNAASGSWGRGVLSNRENILGYAGYVHEPATGAAGGGHGTVWHVRHRVLHSGLGRWVQRDPAGYVDGSSLVEYCSGTPVIQRDSSGLDGVTYGPPSCQSLSKEVGWGVACRPPTGSPLDPASDPTLLPPIICMGLPCRQPAPVNPIVNNPGTTLPPGLWITSPGGGYAPGQTPPAGSCIAGCMAIYNTSTTTALNTALLGHRDCLAAAGVAAGLACLAGGGACSFIPGAGTLTCCGISAVLVGTGTLFVCAASVDSTYRASMMAALTALQGCALGCGYQVLVE